MKFHEPGRRHTGIAQSAPVGKGENPGKKALANRLVAKPSVLLQRHAGMPPGYLPCVGAAATRVHGLPAVGAVHGHRMQPATRRALHENVTVHRLKLGGAVAGIGLEFRRHIDARVRDAQRPRIVPVAHQLYGRPRDSHADAHLRTDRHVGEQTVQRLMG